MPHLWIALVIGLACCPQSMALDPERARKLARALRDAASCARKSMRRVSQDAEKDQALITRQFACLDGLGGTLASQEATHGAGDLLQWLALTLAREFGTPAECDTAERLTRMVKMDLVSERRRTA